MRSIISCDLAQGFWYNDVYSQRIRACNHCHESYEILFIEKGRGRFVIEGKEYVLKPRTLFLVRPLAYHFVEVEAGEYERYVFNFSASYISPDVREHFLHLVETMGQANGFFYPPERVSTAIISVFDRFDFSEGLEEKKNELYAKLLISELVLLLSASSMDSIVHDPLDLGSRVAKHINENLDKANTLDELAHKFFVSKYYLCRVFKSSNGISLHSYVTLKRVLYAKQLIEGGETASGAAYKVGFGDYSAFYRAYVKFLKVPPKAEGKK